MYVYLQPDVVTNMGQG